MLPSDLASFLDIVREHGRAAYSFLAVYSMANSLLLALFAGYAAQAGALDLSQAIAACWLGTFAGDVVRFWVGRRFGTGWLRGFPRLKRGVDAAASMAELHHVWMILVHRYPRIIRNVAGFAYGASTLAWPRFLLLNLLASGLWATGAVSAGYAFGEMVDTNSGFLQMLGFVMLGAFLGFAWLLARRLERVGDGRQE